MWIGEIIRNAKTYTTLSPTSWQLAFEANEQEAHALIADYVHNMFIGFAVLFLINPFSGIQSVLFALFVVTCYCLPFSTSFWTHATPHTPNLLSCLCLHLCLSLTVSLSLSVFLSLHLSSSWSAISFQSILAVSPTLHHLLSVCIGVPSLLYPVCGIVWGMVKPVRLSFTLSSTPRLSHVCIGAFSFLF